MLLFLRSFRFRFRFRVRSTLETGFLPNRGRGNSFADLFNFRGELARRLSGCHRSITGCGNGGEGRRVHQAGGSASSAQTTATATRIARRHCVFVAGAGVYGVCGRLVLIWLFACGRPLPGKPLTRSGRVGGGGGGGCNRLIHSLIDSSFFIPSFT